MPSTIAGEESSLNEGIASPLKSRKSDWAWTSDYLWTATIFTNNNLKLESDLSGTGS